MYDATATTRSTPAGVTPRPRWGLLYVLASLTLAGLAVGESVGAPDATQTALCFTIVLGGFGAMALWVGWNRVALDQQAWCECAATTVTVRVVGSEPARAFEADVEAIPRPTVPRMLEPVPFEEDDEVLAVGSKA